MARFFKYKTADALARDAEARGLDIRLDPDLGPLLRPITIGPRTAGNRMAIHPMEGCDATADGSPDVLAIRRYERFGAGGAKLIWGEAAAIVPEGRANPRQLVIDEAHADGLSRLLETCRDAHRAAWGDADDFLVGIQLTHSGRYSFGRPVLAQHDPLLDPRTVTDKAAGTRASASTPLITDDELDRLQDTYVRAAALAFRIGFDFVDFKQCHRYLLNELLAARSRPGKYGGPYENRTRFIRDLVGRVRGENPGKILGTRLNLFDSIPYGPGGADGSGVPDPHTLPLDSCWGTRPDDPGVPDLAEPIRLIGDLRSAGLNLLNVSMGNPYANPHHVRPFEYAPVDGYQTPEHPLVGVDRHFRATAEVQAAFPDLAIVGSGYSWLQAWMLQAGAANIRDGRVSLMGVGRGSLSHPEFARYAAEGRPLDPKKTCRTFSYCTALMRNKQNEMGQFPAGCPPFDKAVYGPIWEEAKAVSGAVDH
ncbi:NADH:flavin oxidoreductase [Tundrisphaera sp. TA3]|uniref:oxidoreductase n=1 Tax=Tundrisphaera sp. TA3 TaxID=3435775 RepID=UPI003EB822AB